MTLIISGGFGNIIDRLFRGGLVVDYLDVQLFDFAIFNFADCCVVVGVVLLLIQILFFDKSTSQKTKMNRCRQMNNIILTVPEEASGLRLDKWLTSQIEDLTRTAVQKSC